MVVMPTTDTQQFDELLMIVCEKLQLSPSLHEEAEGHYEAVGKWLDAQDSELRKYSPKIYSQGSFRIGTTTKPIEQEEHDVDLVCEMNLDYDIITPDAALNMVEKRLRENKTYAEMIEQKDPPKRCIRLIYAKKFHLDILPAASEKLVQGTRVRVPDREHKEWKASDPKGYARWFDERSGEYQRALKEKAEPLPDHETVEEKTPLQRVVQLLKRWRDIAFEDDPDAAPRSIVLTTLAGQGYQGEMSTAEAFHVIVGRILEQVKVSPGPLAVYNPSNEDELLSEKWEEGPDSYELFVQQLDQLAQRWEDLHGSVGMQAIKAILAELFGEEITTSAYKTYAERIEASREQDDLGVDRATGILTIGSASGAAAVQRNTFYGEE